MVFNSLSYLLFLPVVYLIFYYTVDRWRWLILLGASYGFYAALRAPYLLAVLFAVTCVSYACGLRMSAQQDDVIRKRWLLAGIFVSVTILVLLKYLPFLEVRTNSILNLSSSLSKGLISIGVSYYVFQAISYMTDIYLEIEVPEKHFGYYALYLAFFPKLLQGPIERSGDLLPQLKKPYMFDYDAMRCGMLLCTWGVFKKVVVADRLAVYSDQVFNNAHEYTGLSLIIGTYAYALQIYFDFSAYTDIARGTGRIFGINLTENFNSPYMATSIADFWRRWHISFSRWILDYIFKPLQMELRNWGLAGTATALIITFLISGIWHGTTYGFIIWGLLHGIFLAASTYYRPHQKRMYKWLGIENKSWIRWWQMFVTFNLVSFAWIFFRANNVGDMWHFTKNIFNFHNNLKVLDTNELFTFIKIIFFMKQHTLDVITILSALTICVTIKRYHNIDLANQPSWIRWSCYYSLIIILLFFSVVSTSKFIYFSF